MTDPRLERSRQAILAAAAECLARNPDAGLSEIARQAGIGRATLYRHFTSREVLLVELATESLEQTERACAFIDEQGLRGRAAIEALFRTLVPMSTRYGYLVDLWRAVEGQQDIRDKTDAQAQQMLTVMDQARQQGEIRTNLPDTWLLAAFDHLLYCSWACIDDHGMPPEQAADLAIETFFRGAGPAARSTDQ